ncbi:MAG: hypothetical protein WBA16_05300 [Nonlabens sp.]
MHLNAYRKRILLKLTDRECFITRTFLQRYLLDMMILLVSIIIVLVAGGQASSLAGLCYVLIGILTPLHSYYRRKKLQRLYGPVVQPSPIYDESKVASTTEAPQITEEEQLSPTDNNDNDDDSC